MSTVFASEGSTGRGNASVLAGMSRPERHAPSLKRAIAVEQSKLLLGTIPIGLIGSLTIAYGTAWSLHGEVSPDSLTLWLTLLTTEHLLRFVYWLIATRSNRVTRYPFGSRLAARLSMLSSGSTWGLALILIFPEHPAFQIFLMMIAVGIIGAAMAELSADVVSASMFTTPVLLPTVMRAMSSADPLLMVIGAMLLIYAPYLLNASRRTQQAFLDLLTLRFTAEEELRYDRLTHLPSRAALDQALPDMLARARAQGRSLAVGFADLDDFKQVNDRHGHGAGDALLVHLGDRWRGALGPDELIARLGGDEFVFVLGDLPREDTMTALSARLDRLHQALERPLPISSEIALPMEITLGLALYPDDGDDPGQLLRDADTAMYLAKQHKHDRASWWWRGTMASNVIETEVGIAPFGREATAVLEKAQPSFELAAASFIDAFYDQLRDNPAADQILRSLDAAEFQALKKSQRAHLHKLMEPGLPSEALRDYSERVGTVHALCGVGATSLSQALSTYRHVLSRELNKAPLTARNRYRLLTLAEARLQQDVQTQLRAGEDLVNAYIGLLAAPLPDAGTLWADASRDALKALGALPGIQACMLVRMDSRGQLVLEQIAGAKAAEIGRVLTSATSLLDFQGREGQMPGVVGQAWMSQSIAQLASCSAEGPCADWSELARSLHVRSMLAMPLTGADGHVMAVLGVFGAYPNQFASTWAMQWSHGLQRHWETVWARCRASQRALVVPIDVAQTYRTRVLSGGLRMAMQPIVNLQTGRVAKMEALARLEMPGGRMVPPAEFIPLLGDAELSGVFRQGLSQTLGYLRQWDSQGLQLDVSINLPPSALRDPDCVHWVNQALQTYGFAPQRLTLEILETQELDLDQQTPMLSAMRALGVRLAMDDLGSGYSSIYRLSALPFDTIKIDQNLLAGLYDNPLQTITLVGTLALMGLDLGRTVVVEGLEDLGMIEAAAVLGAQYGQGYGLSRPMPASEVKDWVGRFTLPIAPSATVIRTAAGALAYHWRFVHPGTGRYPTDLTTCPIGVYLRDNQAEPHILALHHRTHGAATDPEAAQQLTDWLAARLQSVGSSKPASSNSQHPIHGRSAS